MGSGGGVNRGRVLAWEMPQELPPHERPQTSPARLEQLLDASVRMAGEHSLDRVLQMVADASRVVIGAQYAVSLRSRMVRWTLRPHSRPSPGS